MGIRILEGEYDGTQTRAVLIDSVSDRPLDLPMFESALSAEDFVQWCTQKFGARGDPRRLTYTQAEQALAEWRKGLCETCGTHGCACEGCGVKCSEACAPGCLIDNELLAIDRAVQR